MVASAPPITPDRAAAQAARTITFPLWVPLQAVLQQTSGPEGQPVDPALRDYILDHDPGGFAGGGGAVAAAPAAGVGDGVRGDSVAMYGA